LNVSGTIEPTGMARWVQMAARAEAAPGDRDRTLQAIETALKKLGEAKVALCELVTAGEISPSEFNGTMPPSGLANEVKITDLPHFWRIEIDYKRESSHFARIKVWVPVNWNGRFLGVLGGGMHLSLPLGMPEWIRSISLPIAIRNGFAAAETDGGIVDERPAEWGLNVETREIDWDLTTNWVHRGTHEMTVVGKAVTEAVTGSPPAYSYAAGCSGGGRQALVEAQRYPGDYDGIWASDPAIHFCQFIIAGMWPPLVMKEVNNVVAPEKFEAFRKAAIDACDGIDGIRDGLLGAFDDCDFDARSIIG
jgi:Tannase and feruloyl esterase